MPTEPTPGSPDRFTPSTPAERQRDADEAARHRRLAREHLARRARDRKAVHALLLDADVANALDTANEIIAAVEAAGPGGMVPVTRAQIDALNLLERNTIELVGVPVVDPEPARSEFRRLIDTTGDDFDFIQAVAARPRDREQ